MEEITKKADNGNKKKKKKTSFSEKLAELWQDKRPFKRRLLTAFLAALALIFTVFIFGPLEIYMTNATFFTFSFRFLVIPIVIAGVILTALLTAILSLLRGKIYNYAVSLVISCTVGCYLQGNFINIDHGSLDGASIVWQDFKGAALLGMLLWTVLILLPLALQYFSRKTWRKAVNIVAILLIAMQGVALTVLCFRTNLANVSDYGFLNRDGIFEVSDKKNVIVFMLDRFDKTYADHQLEGYYEHGLSLPADPAIAEGLSGFTYYENFTGTYTYTYPSVAYLLTGIKTDYTIPPLDYLEKAWSESTFLSDIRAAGYHTRVFSEINYMGGKTEFLKEEAENISLPTGKIPADKILSAMYGLSAYRYLPEIMKPYFHTYTGDISYGYIYGDENGSAPYGLDDVRFRAELLAQGLTVDPTSNGSFLFYHLQGAHDPFVMNKDGEKDSFSNYYEGRFEQVQGNFKTILAYIDMLKEKGVYDDTTIIITADHGYTGSYTELTFERVLGLFIKPADADTSEPLKRSHKQICQDNLRASISSYFGLTDENGVDKLGYRTIESIGEEEEMVRYFYMSGRNDAKTLRDYRLITYKITGDANNFDNWEKLSTEKIKHPYYDAAGRKTKG